MIHKISPEFFITDIFINELVTGKDAMGVGIDHKGGHSQGIKQDTVRRLRSDALHRKATADEGIPGAGFLFFWICP